MQKRFPRLWLAAELVTFMLASAALSLDLNRVFDRVEWQWWAFGFFLGFGVLVYVHISELTADLNRLKADQKTELALRAVQEKCRVLELTLDGSKESIGRLREWALPRKKFSTPENLSRG